MNLVSAPVNLRKKVFRINSTNRDSTSPTSNPFSINVDMPHRNSFNQMSCLVAEVPKSWYMNGPNLNTFKINGTDVQLQQPVVAPAVIGRNYSVNELRAELEASLIADLGGVWTVTFDSNSSKFTITGPAPWTWNGDVNNPVFSKYFGLPQASLASTGNVIVSPNAVNLSRYDSLEIRSSMCLNNNNDILVTLFPDSFNEFGTINFTNDSSGESSVAVSNNERNNYRFSLVDSNNELVDLNGLEWKMVIVCWSQE